MMLTYHVLGDQDPETRKGIYKHPVLQKAVNVMWFLNKHNEGVVFGDDFSPIPIPALALVLTAVSNAYNHHH